MKKDENSYKMAASALKKLSDEELRAIQFTMPWQIGADVPTDDTAVKDADGFSSAATGGDLGDREKYQRLLWEKFQMNPQVGTAVRGQVGRLTGFGFDISSEIPEIQDAIEENEYDPRNRLYSYWSKYVGRAIIEGELFLCLTVHPDGFIETDFIDPSNIAGGGEDGIIYHPTKATLPLFYFVSPDTSSDVAKKLNVDGKMLIPSIFVGYYPEVMKLAKDLNDYQENLTKDAKGKGSKYSSLGGFNRFIVSWDRSFVTRRNVSYLRTILMWLNHYENLKKYEIDHKKSAGAYLWIVTMEDPKTFRTWLALTDEQRRKTGIMAKKVPGSTLVLPPGMKVEAKNPSLPSISDTDTDILHMVTGGLNEPEDVSTGQSKGTFASVKASRGPMSDRISDEIAYFERFLKYDYYRAIFFLKSKVSKFPEKFSVRKAIEFDKNQKPVFKKVDRSPMFLMDVSFPSSEVTDVESRARAFLGVKHGSVYDTLGIPNAVIASKMGFGNYRRLRLDYETEVDKYPELMPPVDSGGQQLEPGNKKLLKNNKKMEEGKTDIEDNSTVTNKKTIIKKKKEQE